MKAAEMAELADAYWVAYQARLKADKEAKALKVKESALEAQILESLRTDNITGIGGKLVMLTIPKVPDYVPTVSDWQVFSELILSSKDLSLLERRVGKAAVKERWDANVEVPGVVKFPVYKLHKHAL